MKSFALVIGNNDYQFTTKLNNAVKDAKDVANKLENLGFEVLKSTDCNACDFANILSEYKSKIESSNSDVVSLFYYAGHAIQIEGKNYLLPTNVSTADESSAKYTSIPFDEIIKDICQPNVQVKIFILDACRDNPFSGSRSVTTIGLAPIYAPKGSLIAFSTSPGEKATDGISGENSIYTKALLTHIGVPNISIEECFKRVRESVYSLTNEKQLSWEHTSLIGKYCFNNGSNYYSTKIPYSDEVVMDSLYANNGSEFSQIIFDLKSCNWYTQEPAIKKILRKSSSDYPDKNDQFLLGRNILQVVDGGERTIDDVFNNRLNSFLSKWFNNGENHLLNGILYEIYFDRNSSFRGILNLKANYLEQICNLSTNINYKNSFDFISNVLTPFANYLLFVPCFKPSFITLNFFFIKTKFPKWYDDDEENVIALNHISKDGLKILELTPNIHNCDEIKYSELKNKIYQWFYIPERYMIICKNIDIQDNETIWVPRSRDIDSYFMDYLKK